MSHPKNTTEAPPTQAGPLVTMATKFNQNGGEYFFSTVPGISCSEAFNFASANLSAAEDLLGQLVQVNASCNLAFAIRALVGQARALIDSGVGSVEQAEDLAPQNQPSPVRGAEVSQ